MNAALPAAPVLTVPSSKPSQPLQPRISDSLFDLDFSAPIQRDTRNDPRNETRNGTRNDTKNDILSLFSSPAMQPASTNSQFDTRNQSSIRNPSSTNNPFGTNSLFDNPNSLNPPFAPAPSTALAPAPSTAFNAPFSFHNGAGTNNATTRPRTERTEKENLNSNFTLLNLGTQANPWANTSPPTASTTASNNIWESDSFGDFSQSQPLPKKFNTNDAFANLWE